MAIFSSARKSITIYFSDGRSRGIWSILSSGGEPTQVLSTDTRILGKGYFAVSDSNLYYALREIQSDIWKLDLSIGNSE